MSFGNRDRNLRSKGIDELTDIVEDMGFIWQQVRKRNWWQRRFYKKQEHKQFKALEPDYMHLIIENQLEATNCAYESLIEKYGSCETNKE